MGRRTEGGQRVLLRLHLSAKQIGRRMFYFEPRWQRCLSYPCLFPSPRSVCVRVCVRLRCVCFFSLGIAFVFRCANGAKCHRMKFHARLHGNSDSVCHASLPPSPPHMHRRSAPTFSFPHLALIKQRQQWQSEAKRGTSNENASSEILRGTKQSDDWCWDTLEAEIEVSWVRLQRFVNKWYIDSCKSITIYR